MKIIVLLSILHIAAVYAKFYEKCELAKELFSTHGLDQEDVGHFMCISGERNNYNTRASSNSYYGLFAIGSEFWCDEFKSGNRCNVKCSNLLDDNISDDVRCAMKVFKGLGLRGWNIGQETCHSYLYDAKVCLKQVKNTSKGNNIYQVFHQNFYNGKTKRQ